MYKTSELISKMALASEEACKCEDKSYLPLVKEYLQDKVKSEDDYITARQLVSIVRASTDFTRFASIRAICKVLQELGIAENDIDVFNDDAFCEVLEETYHFDD